MLSMIDFVIIACGGYVIYLCLAMKSTGKLKENMLMPKGLDLKRCKDTAGFIRAIAMKQFWLGIVAIVCGIVGLLQDYGVITNSAVYMLFLLVFAAYAVWYAVYMKKAVKRFW